MKCEGFAKITDLMDYLDNNRLIAHYGGFNIMESLPSYWTYDRFLRQWRICCTYSSSFCARRAGFYHHPHDSATQKKSPMCEKQIYRFGSCSIAKSQKIFSPNRRIILNWMR